MLISYKEHIIITSDNSLITSPNCSQLTSEVPPFDDEIGQFATPQQLHQLNWADNKRPYLPYTLCQNTFTSSFLSRLNYNFWSLPIEVTTGWRLAPAITESWKRLEDTLRLTYQLLFEHSNHLFPLELMEPRLPLTYNLHQLHISEKHARKRAMHARDAFLPLIAYCTYAISLYTRASHYVIQDGWYNILIREKMHPPTVDAIRDSEIATFTIPRAGVIVHAISCLYTGDLHRMVKAEVPVFIYWGTVFQPIRRSSNILSSHGPTREETREHYLRRFQNVSSDWLAPEDHSWEPLSPSQLSPMQFPLQQPTHIAPRSHPLHPIFGPHSSNSGGKSLVNDVWEPMDTSVSSFSRVDRTPSPVLDLPQLPKPERASGQRKGETWQEFMVRREEARKKLLDYETLQQKQRRESHLQVSTRGPVRSSNVFVWQKDDDTGFRIRSRIPKHSAYVVWEDYPSMHRRYDAVFNEWDICSEFGGEDRSHPPEQDSDTDEAQVPYIASVYAPTLNEERNRCQVVSSLTTTLEIDASDIYLESDSSLPFPLMFLEYALEKRYGFSENSVPNVTKGLTLGNPLSDMDWHNLSKNYAQRPLMNNVLPHFRLLVNYFTNTMLSLDFDDRSFPSEHIWDLRSSHFNSIHSKILASPFGIEPLIVEDKTMYEIKTNSSASHLEVNWHLVLEDGLTALQCIRTGWGPSLKDIAIGLASTGATFHMFRAFSTPPRPVHGALNAPLLGYRPHGYIPTAADYAAYLEIRNDVLQEARCRAAITRGGILWRLAIESLLPALVIDRDITFDFLQHGSTRSFLTQSGVRWEDALTEADEMAICGVYHVYTGIGQQTAHKSWWPKPSVWAMRGLNVGYWSAGCEHWYQGRLKMIKEGKAELRSAAEWMQSLTSQVKTTRKIVAAHEKAARNLLHGQYL